MAGGKFSEAQLHGMTIRESATDGSDFTNPAADYRRLFLGEDGQLHVKDSSGTVTDIGVASGMSNPMTTAEDIIYGGASGTPARKALGASNSFLGSSNSALAYVPLGTIAQAPSSLNAVAAPSSADNFAAGWRRGSMWV